MKFAVRTFAIALVAVGAFASTRSPRTVQVASSSIMVSSAMPAPACSPNEPGGCSGGRKW